MQIVKDIYLDFYQSEPVLVTAKEGDVGRFLHVTLLDNGNIFPVPSGSTVTFSRDDVWNGCTVNDDGTILAPITADMRPGRVPAQIEVSYGNDHLSSWHFILDVQNSARNDAAIEGNNDFSAIQTLLDQVQGAIDATNTAIANVNAAIANMGDNFASLANTQNITQLATNAKTLVGGINELNSKTELSFYDGKLIDKIKSLDVNEFKIMFFTNWNALEDSPDAGYGTWVYVIFAWRQSESNTSLVYSKILAFRADLDGSNLHFWIGTVSNSEEIVWSDIL